MDSKPKQVVNSKQTETYTMSHTIEDDIERIVYVPRNRRFQTPVLMQHGMWHGAWCWQLWQELLAEWGWESYAFSLPGHAGSPRKRPIALCTLGYYLKFLKAEVKRLPQRPILMGHSMGGALTQWYLKYVGDDLPAAVLVAAWPSHHVYQTRPLPYKYDIIGTLLSALSFTATPLIRNPQRAAHLLISSKAVYSPEELHAKLGPESLIIMNQYIPPFWKPPKEVQTPMLCLAGEVDVAISADSVQKSAAYY